VQLLLEERVLQAMVAVDKLLVQVLVVLCTYP
jgi:hypothetical protein